MPKVKKRVKQVQYRNIDGTIKTVGGNVEVIETSVKAIRKYRERHHGDNKLLIYDYATRSNRYSPGSVKRAHALWNRLFKDKHVDKNQFIDSEQFRQVSSYYENNSIEYKYHIVLLVGCNICQSAYTISQQKIDLYGYKCRYCYSPECSITEYKVIGIYYKDNYKKRTVIDFNKRVITEQLLSGLYRKYYTWQYTQAYYFPTVNKASMYYIIKGNEVKCHTIKPTKTVTTQVNYLEVTARNQFYYTERVTKERLNERYFKTLSLTKQRELF